MSRFTKPLFSFFGSNNNRIHEEGKFTDSGAFLKVFGGSSYNCNIQVKDAKFECTTVMFNGMDTIFGGTLKAKYIIVHDQADIHFGKNFLINGDIYLVNTKDFNAIANLWSNKDIEPYLLKQHLKPTHYSYESFDTYYDSLKELHDHHYDTISNTIL